MIHKEYTWNGYDGIRLFAQNWAPDKNPSVVINYVHGFKDHSCRFSKWAIRLAENGFGVVAIDLRGHGHSEGRRGYAKSFRSYLEDAGILMQNSRNLFKDSLHILYGHSLGGNIVANYLINGKNLPHAAVIASPWFTLTTPPPVFKVMMARLIRYTIPSLTLKSDIEAGDLSNDQKIVEDYRNDPLVHNLILPKLFIEIEKNGLKASRGIYKINIPLLVMHGTADKICSFRQTRSFVMNAGALTVFKEWPGAFHELHNDVTEKEVFAYVLNWLLKMQSPVVSNL